MLQHSARLIVAWAFLVGATALAAAEEYRIMTGPQGGSWYPLGGAVSNLVRQHTDGIRLRVMPGGGVANVKAVEAGKAHIALGNVSSTIDAMIGRPPFDEPVTHIRQLVTLYPQVFQIVVRANAGIDSIADLAGTSLAVGPRGHTGEQTARDVLQAYGLSYDDFANVNHVGYTDSVSLMKDGHIDVFMIITTVPAGAVMDVGSARDIKLLSVDDDRVPALQEINSQYQRRVIAAGTYPDQDQAVHTIGTWTHLLVHADLPETSVYDITKAIAENRASLAAVVSALDDVSLEHLATDVGVPRHPGAERYFREAGVLGE